MLVFLFISLMQSQLVVRKTILNKHVVAGQPFAVQIQLFNAGSIKMVDLVVKDRWKEDLFESDAGFYEDAKFLELEPGNNISYTYILTPKHVDPKVDVKPCVVRYSLVSAQDDTRASYSSVLPSFSIAARHFSDRVPGANMKEFGFFMIFCAGLIIFPTLFWTNSRHSKK